jgi:hypothetical protein
VVHSKVEEARNRHPRPRPGPLDLLARGGCISSFLLPLFYILFAQIDAFRV